jgi:putative ABC transport system permease protein
MLQLKHISKEYKTGDFVQKALDDVSLNLRDNEFVAVLGPSGAGKTTLLNIIGGLDRYDSGELIINSISTKKYKDRDWDSYRNHTVGFVFQSYNLIPHQSVLSNVELALTISGIPKKERRRRAEEALKKVGLEDHMNKKPNQLSGGQMQRVAIARALVNEPDILLADEPTGALDTETSIQIMDLLKEVASDRLVVMVTHNPDLAEKYSTRIVRLRDGKIISDSDPYIVEDTGKKAEYKNMGKSSMSIWTSMQLSFNNLKTKRGRTFLTSFAGSIGIIGIALIMALSAGVNAYIEDIQKSTMTSYPITIESQTIDVSSVMQEGMSKANATADHDLDKVYADDTELDLRSMAITENNLTDFKKYLDDPDCEINQYVGENGIIYTYDTDFNVYTYDDDGNLVNTDGSGLEDTDMLGVYNYFYSYIADSDNAFTQINPGSNGELISPIIEDSYDVLYGRWPEAYNEIVLVLDQNNEIYLLTLCKLGILTKDEYTDIVEAAATEKDVESDVSYTYEEIVGRKYYLIPQCDMYEEGEDGLFTDISDDETKVQELVDNNSVELTITGIVRSTGEDVNVTIGNNVGYTEALTEYIMNYTDESAVVQAQEANPDIDVTSGVRFDPADDAEKIEDLKNYVNTLGVSEKARMIEAVMASDAEALASFSGMTETELAAVFDNYIATATDDVLLDLYDTYISPGTYDSNLAAFGVVSEDTPSSISIYVDSFADKEAIADCIAEYNSTASSENQITYVDTAALMMSTATNIVNVVTYVLIAFVAVSLVVSSIMIGIITYISVLERTKEIGILRAMGASKHNITEVFNSETFFIGLLAGLIGIGLSELLLIPGNALLHHALGYEDINAFLPPQNALLLIVLSVILTIIGGLIPSKKAARRDPVVALRSE